MYWTLVSSLDFCLISSLFFNFYCITAHVSPPKVRYPVKTLNGVPPPPSPPIQQQPIGGQQQLSDIQNIQSDWIKVVGPNGYPIRGNRLTSNYIPAQLSGSPQLPPFPPPPSSIPGSYFLPSSSQQTLPIYSPNDSKDNPIDLKSPPQAPSSLSSSSWSKVYPSGQSGSIIWPNQFKPSTS